MPSPPRRALQSEPLLLDAGVVEALPDTMQAAVYLEKGRLEVQQRPLPEVGPGQVLLRVSHCGVCGTDLHLIVEGWGRPGSIGGHEYSGTVVAVGPGVDLWQVGDRVVGGPEPSCGSCASCCAGRPSLCTAHGAPGVAPFQGAFAEYKLVSAAQLLRIPPGLSERDAALAEPLAVALHGITLSGIRPGERALITGAGPIGMLTLAALRARGVEEVWISEPSSRRRELAGRVGATRVLEPEELPFPRMPFEVVGTPCDVAFECSGSPRAFRQALVQLGKAGRLVVLGTGMKRPELDTNRVLLNELIVTGAYNYDANGFHQALALLDSGALPTDRLIEPGEVSLRGMLRALEGLASGAIAGKVMVAPEG